MRDYPAPERIPGEDNWEWCQRYADSIPAESLMQALVEYLDNRKRPRKETEWVFRDIFCHGSGVSHAIVERFRRKEETKP